ncbi:MAG: GPR endopeptidase [Firmicutes bacterium]|nr:GPR endopeptidase [Bacillota bacterium]
MEERERRRSLFPGMQAIAARLDMAAEAAEVLRGEANVEIAGVRETVREKKGVRVHVIQVLNQKAAARMGKPQGTYVTCQIPMIQDEKSIAAAAAVIGEELAALLPPLAGKTLLVAGLGNREAIPDALGPRVAELSFATRHLFEGGEDVAGLNRVCVLCPGVTGMTGLDAAESISALARQIQPAAVLLVDALAAASVSRVGVSVQLADTGLCPGGGVGNERPVINQESCGCPVISIGIPTVVDTAAIIDGTLQALGGFWKGRGLCLPALSDEACRYAEEELLRVFGGRLMVTPKDIDQMIADDAEILAAAIAIAVHPAAGMDNYHDFIR